MTQQCHTTAAVPLPSGLINTAASSPSITQRTFPPSSPVTSSSSSGSSGASDMVKREIARKAQRKFIPYPKPNIAEALELRFTERSLLGNHTGRGDAKAVLLRFYPHYGTQAYRFIGGAYVSQWY